MADDEDYPTTEELRVQQSSREQEELARAAAAPSDGEERAAVRRAQKAGYLKDKLEQQAASDARS